MVALCMEEVIVRTQRIAILANLLAHLWVSLEQDSQVNTLIRAGDPLPPLLPVPQKGLWFLWTVSTMFTYH